MHNQLFGKNKITQEIDLVLNKENYSPEYIWERGEEIQVMTSHAIYDEFILCKDTLVLDVCTLNAESNSL